MDQAYVRLLFVRRGAEAFAILTIRSDRQRTERYLEDRYIA